MSRLRTTASRNGRRVSTSCVHARHRSLVRLERSPRRARVDVDQRFAVRDRQHERDRSAGHDRDRNRHARLDVDPTDSTSQRDRERAPAADERIRRAVDARGWRCDSPRRGSNSIVTSIGRTPSRQAAHEQRCGQEATRELGHHALGERQLARRRHSSRFRASRCRVGTGAVRCRPTCVGPTRNVPACGPPTSRPNSGSPSKCGAHIQSIAPSDETSAAVRVSPMSP